MSTERNVDHDLRDRVELPLMVPYDVALLTAILESFPELREQLAPRWPVRSIWLVLKNPLPAKYSAFRLSELEIRVALRCADTLPRAAADQLLSEAEGWLRSQFRRIK